MPDGEKPSHTEAELNLIEFLANTRYLIFAENDFIANNGLLEEQRALLPAREKKSEDSGEAILTQKEIQKRQAPFRPYNQRDYTPIGKTHIKKMEVIKKTFSKRLAERTRKTAAEILREDFKGKSRREIEEWAYYRLAMLEKYGITMDHLLPPTPVEVKEKTFSKQLEQKTQLTVAQMLNEKLTTMNEHEIEQWAQWELEGLKKEAHYIRDFTATIRRIKRMAEHGLESAEEGRDTEQVPEKKTINLVQFSEKITQLRKDSKPDPTKKPNEVRKQIYHAKKRLKNLAEGMQDSLLKEMAPQSSEDEKKFLKDSLSELSRTANDYFNYLRGKYFYKSQDVALNAEVEDCHHIGELFLMAFDKNFIPKVRREAANKLLLMMILLELQKHSKENDEAMSKMTEILNQKVFVLQEGEKIGKTHKDFLYSTHDPKGETLQFRIERKERKLRVGERKSELQRRRFFKKNGKEYFVAMGNREKNLLQRLSKLLREGKTPGESENDLNGLRFMVENKENHTLLMELILKGVEEAFYESAETKLDLIKEERGPKLRRVRNEIEEIRKANKDDPKWQELFLLAESIEVEEEEEELDPKLKKLVAEIKEIKKAYKDDPKWQELFLLAESIEADLEDKGYLKLREWVSFVPQIKPGAKDKKGELYILNLTPIPISGHKLKELRSKAAIEALGQDITQAPVFITEFKDNLDGSKGFDGSSNSSSNKLEVLKFKLHVANPQKPGEYDQYEMQFYLPKGYADMLHAEDIRHRRYGIGRVFEKLVPMIFGEKIYNIDHTKAKKKALEKEKANTNSDHPVLSLLHQFSGKLRSLIRNTNDSEEEQSENKAA